MRYLNASEILPDELLREIQKYTQGETLYIPKENERKKWGENSGSRSYYIERNSKILEKYREGQKKKVLIAGSLLQQAHLYIWDEPLNYIDIFSRMQIEELIMKYNPTMLIVEHDRFFGERCAHQKILL